MWCVASFQYVSFTWWKGVCWQLQALLQTAQTINLPRTFRVVSRMRSGRAGTFEIQAKRKKMKPVHWVAALVISAFASLAFMPNSRAPSAGTRSIRRNKQGTWLEFDDAHERLVQTARDIDYAGHRLNDWMHFWPQWFPNDTSTSGRRTTCTAGFMSRFMALWTSCTMRTWNVKHFVFVRNLISSYHMYPNVRKNVWNITHESLG